MQNKKRPALSKAKGFTLVELLLYMGLLSFLLAVLTSIFVSVVDVQLESQATSTVNQDGDYIISRLNYDIGRAKQLILPANPADQSPTLNILINGINYTYSLNGQDMTLTNNLGTFTLNSFDTIVSNLNFKNISNSPAEATQSATINISFTLASKTTRQNGPEVRNIGTTIGLRIKQ